jgi:hypothetical protein
MQNLLINTLRPADDQECDVEAHLLYATYSQEPLNQTMAVITAVFGGAIVWGIVPVPQLSLWIAAVLGSAALGHVQYQFFKRQHHPVPLSKNGRKYFLYRQRRMVQRGLWDLSYYSLTAAAFCQPFLSAPYCASVPFRSVQ